MNKGFTLVELLAVIVILMVILAITIPNFMKTISKSEKKAFISSVDLVLTAAETYVTDKTNNFILPAINVGKRVTVTELTIAENLTNTNDIINSIVVVYNDNGTYKLYAFISDGRYKIEGYVIEDVENNIEEESEVINYDTLMPYGNYFHLNEGDPQLKYN